MDQAEGLVTVLHPSPPSLWGIFGENQNVKMKYTVRQY
jgi:hypothetical protein